MNQPDQVAISVTGLTKSFKVPTEASSGIKQKTINLLKGKKGYRTFTPLKDINFNVKKGEFFGIVGRNGSGKSTLLKTIAGIYCPTAGSVQVNGSLTPFIELGVGFNPELTGRENVYLNGALLGFSRAQMDSMYHGIVQFAELEEFMDQKLKNYSSGMQVRLAFSIAIRAESDILLFDEVLAVGDAAFQQKCYEMFSEIKKSGTTVVLVTHDMAAVQRFCDRGILIDDGLISLAGDPMDIADRYLEDNFENNSPKEDENPDDTKFSISNIALTPHKRSVDIYSDLKLSFDVNTKSKDKYQIGFQIFRTDGVYVYGTNTKNSEKGPFTGDRSIVIDFSENLAPGTYTVTLAVMNDEATSVKKYLPKVSQFSVKQQTKRQGVVLIDERWSVENI